jgi:hypothetical protein
VRRHPESRVIAEWSRTTPNSRSGLSWYWPNPLPGFLKYAPDPGRLPASSIAHALARSIRSSGCLPAVELPAFSAASIRQEQVEVVNAVVFLPDSKTPNGVAEAPLTEVALSAFKNQLKFPVSARFKQDKPNRLSDALQKGLSNSGAATPAQRIFGRMIFAQPTRPDFRLGGVADEWVT